MVGPQIDPGVLDMLSALRESGYSVTVVSNTTHEEVSAWSSCELADLIEDPVFSFEVGAMKPDPAIYAVLSPVQGPRGPEFA